MKQETKTEVKKTSLMDYTRASLEIFAQLEAQAEANEGEVDDALALSLEKNDELFQDKALKCAYAALHITSEANFIDERIKELTARKKALQNNSKRLKDYLKLCMISTERKQIKNDMLSITVKNTAIWPTILDPNQIPPEYKTTTLTLKGDYVKVSEFLESVGGFLSTFDIDKKVVSVPNKSKVKDAILAGKPVPGAVMPDSSTSITIK